MIGLVAWLVRSTLGDSLFAARLLPAMAHAATVGLAACLAREMGGARYAQFAAALATALAPAYLGICGILSMNAFDILFWAALWLVSARALRTGDSRPWLLFGLVAGLGLQNKISVLFVALGSSPVSWPGAGGRSDRRLGGRAMRDSSFLTFWQWHYGCYVEFMANATREKNVSLPAAAFMIEQVMQMGALAAPLWIAGLGGLLASGRFRAFRPIGWAYLAVLAIMLASNAKPYYLAPAYMALAAGAVVLKRSAVDDRPLLRGSRRRQRRRVPSQTRVVHRRVPALPAALGWGREGGGQELGGSQQHAYMYGWRNRRQLASVYHALPPGRSPHSGPELREAGVMSSARCLACRSHPGPQQLLPWGPRGCTGGVVIALGGERTTRRCSGRSSGRLSTRTDCMP
jgi:hypothetical protein